MSDDANPHGIPRTLYPVPNTEPVRSHVPNTYPVRASVPNTYPVRANVPNTHPLSPQFGAFYSEPDPAGAFSIPKDGDMVTETSLEARKKAVADVSKGVNPRRAQALQNLAIQGRSKTHK